jgi:cytochrome b subunit of formate dehydrogenase
MSEKVTRAYERFPLARRIEHWVMMLSFTLLGLTGLPQKFPSSDLSIAFVYILGGIENLRRIHHVAAIVMMLGTAWHILVFGYLSYVRRARLTMIPTLQDVKDGWQALMYNIGRQNTASDGMLYLMRRKWNISLQVKRHHHGRDRL